MQIVIRKVVQPLTLEEMQAARIDEQPKGEEMYRWDVTDKGVDVHCASLSVELHNRDFSDLWEYEVVDG